MMINVKKITLFAHWAATQRQMQQLRAILI